MHNHDNFKNELVKILNEPIPEDNVGFEENITWIWTLQSDDRVRNYNFEVTIEKDGTIYLVIHNNPEGKEVCTLEDTTEELVIEKAKAWKSKVWR